MFTFLILPLLAACSLSEKSRSESIPTPTPTPAFTPIVAPPPLSIEEVRAHKTMVEIGMQQVINRAKTFSGANPDAIAQAEVELALFKNGFAPMAVEHVSEGLRITAIDTCPTGACMGYTVAEPREGVIAAYDTVAGAIAFSTATPANDPYTPFVMFHELSHVMDQLNGYIQGGSLSDAPVAGTSNPTETQAYGLEAELLNAATHGEYFRMAEDLAHEIATKNLSFITLTPGPVTFFHPPESMYLLMGKKISEAGRQGLTICMTLSVNRVLINTQLPKSVDPGPRHITLYNDTMNALHSEPVQKFMQGAFYVP